MNLKKILVVGIFVVFGGAGMAIPAYAKECALNQSKFDVLLSADDSQNYFKRLKEELVLRKELISNTIACSIEEASALRARVDKSSDSQIKEAGRKISGLLWDAIGYYNLQLTKVPDLGLEGSRYFAKDLLVWRRGNYAPIAKTALNFIVWSENQSLVRTAKNRLDQIGGAVTILKLIENESVQKKWEEAGELFNAAATENKNARLNLENLGSPEETLASIKLSLKNLSDTYTTLSDLVTEIKDLTSKIKQPEEK